MKIKDIQFMGSFDGVRTCPESPLPEYAFIGRSNVGKSSLINMLLDRKNVARTSSTPGKTQLLNLFCINKSWNICDLPGYGYAKVSKTKRVKWHKMIRQYLTQRPNLMLAFVLVDGNIPPQKIDLEFIGKLGEDAIPFHIIYTKVDKSKKDQHLVFIRDFEEKLLEQWSELPKSFISSSKLKLGKEELLEYITSLNKSVPSS